MHKMQSVDPQNGKNFWKKNSKSVPGSMRAVYGAMHPPITRCPRSSPRKESTQKKPESNDSFQDYQESVNDAWDCGDDEFCVISDEDFFPVIGIPSSTLAKDPGNWLSTASYTAAQDIIQNLKVVNDLAEYGMAQILKFSAAKTRNEKQKQDLLQDVKISNRMVQSAALSVINSHRSGQLANSNLAELHSQLQPTTVSTEPPLAEVLPNTSVNNIHSSTAVLPSAAPIEGVLPLSRLDPSAATHRTPVISTSGSERDMVKQEKFIELISSNNTNLPELRKLSWSGIPPPVRAVTWRLLNGYLPANAERREDTLKRKQEEYWSFVKQYYDTRHEDIYQDTFRQIHIDIPRMSPLVPLFQQTIVQEMFERILYIWAIRHPASGYVQGINDLVTPFFIVFLHEVVPKEENLDTYDVEQVSEEDRAVVEADSFWCMSKLLDGIQDNYTFAQPGIQTKVQQLGELMKRIDCSLHQHLERHEIDYLQFSFRWFNNLLMREMPLACTVRLWDTLHAEPDGFSHFVLYVCAAFLKYFSQHLMAQRDFQGLMLLLQNLPTSSWSDSEISLLVAEAFRLKYMFADAPNHLQANKK